MTDGTRLVGPDGLTVFLRQIFRPGEARNAVFPRSDSDLALTLRAFERTLIQNGNYGFGWFGETETFIENNLPSDSPV
jgi:hypothetical protein